VKSKRVLLGIGALTATIGLSAGVAVAGHVNPLLEGDLDGRREVSAAANRGISGDPDARGEAYVFGIDADRVGGQVVDTNADTLCYLLLVDKLAELDQAPGNGRAAHIHRGAAGTNGPVVANLAWPQGGDASDCLTEGEDGKGMAPGIVQEILADPAGFYVNVHNAEYPNGAVRAQLAAHDAH
jgi:hypothetical protein